MNCDCDFESPKIYNVKEPVARKEHICCECRCTIKPGEQYEKVEGLWENKFTTYKTCNDCLKIRLLLETEAPCYCLVHGTLMEDFYDTMNECYKFTEKAQKISHRKKTIMEEIKEYYEQHEEHYLK